MQEIDKNSFKDESQKDKTVEINIFIIMH